MRASLATGLLAVAFLGNLSGVVQGLPVAQTADVASREVTQDGDLILERSEDGHEIEAVPRDDNGFINHHFKGLLARVIPPKPPPPPPLPKIPITRPNEGGAGAGAGAGAGGSRTGGVPINRPPAREPTPPRPDLPEGQPGVNRNRDENPGSGSGTGNPPQDMETYRAAGAAQMTNYEAILRSGKKDTPIVQTEAELAGVAKNDAFLDIHANDQYRLEARGVTASDVKELKVFTSGELGFDPKVPPQLMSEIRVSNSRGELVNRGTYDKEGRFIVYQDAFKEADTATGVKKTPLNEVGMQLFLAEAGDKAKNFRVAFLSNVQNQEFWAMVKQAYTDLGQEFKQVLTFERGTPQFERFMGSPNFFSKFFSFSNHREAIGNKVPDKVIVAPKQVEGNTSGGLAVAIVFKDLDA